jgi:hypothetical protein
MRASARPLIQEIPVSGPESGPYSITGAVTTQANVGFQPLGPRDRGLQFPTNRHRTTSL